MFKYLLLTLFFLYSSPRFFAANGRVVHIAWTENSDGSIQEAQTPQHAFYLFEQSNQLLNYKDPNNPFFKIRFTWLGIDWTLVHFFAILLTIFLQILTFRRINRRMAESRFFRRWSYRFLKLFLWAAVIAGNIAALWAIDLYNTQIHFRYHQLTDFKNASSVALDQALNNRTYFQPKESTRLRFQLFRENNGKWHTQRALPVLHFKQNKKGQLFFTHDSRYVRFYPDAKRVKAPTQLVVIHRRGENKKMEQALFQIQNGALVPFLSQAERPQRILLFVNGYRPISSSQDPEQALQDRKSVV